MSYLMTLCLHSQIGPTLGATATMFCLLASHFVMLPLREEAGVSLGKLLGCAADKLLCCPLYKQSVIGV